jgi:hypothetical protein
MDVWGGVSRRVWPLLVGLAMLAPLLVTQPAAAARVSKLRSYEGLGAWVDVYDRGLWDLPTEVVQALDAHRVHTLFLQTSTWRIRDQIYRPSATDAFIEEAHRRHMRVVAWYVPDFADLRRDLRRSVAAIRYRTAGGERFDSFALDIESFRVPNPATRSARLVQLSAQIRNAAGGRYSLGAIVISPVATHRVPSGWPGFPYRSLSDYYDVFLPMGYYTFRFNGAGAAFDYTSDTMRLLRSDTGKPNLPIHAIGGLAESTDAAEGRAFVRATRRYHAIGASLYDFNTTGPEDWTALERVRAERPPKPKAPPQRPSFPVEAPLYLRLIVIYSPSDVELWSVPFSSVIT